MFISTNGMVQRTSVKGINRYGRGSQGVRVMNCKDDDTVSAVALVMDSEGTSAAVAELAEEGPLTEAQTGALEGGNGAAPEPDEAS